MSRSLRVAFALGLCHLSSAAAQRAMSLEDRCARRIAALPAMIHAGAYDAVQSSLEQIDAECVSTAAYSSQAADIQAARGAATLSPLPTTGMDFSALDQFWPLADLLAKDTEPGDADWKRMMSTVGYRLSMLVVPTTRSDMEIALRPSRRAEFDSLSTKAGDQASRLVHLRRVLTHRASLAHCRDSIEHALPVQEAVAMAGKFLPPHGTETIAPPLVGFAIFRNDAYSLGPTGVVVDLEKVCSDGGLTLLLAHEFHHSYLSALTTIGRPPNDAPDAAIVYALMAMRNEGIADLIDKPYPLSYPNSTLMAAYAKRYNEAYARTPAVLKSIDSALVVAADDSTKLGDVGRRVQMLLPSAGHYNGSYVAREIYETFGADSLFPGVRNQFAFLRTYTAAETKRGNPPPFSPKAVALLDQLEKRYTIR